MVSPGSVPPEEPGPGWRWLSSRGERPGKPCSLLSAVLTSQWVREVRPAHPSRPHPGMRPSKLSLVCV